MARSHRTLRNLLVVLVLALFAAWLMLILTKGRFLKQPFERAVAQFTDREVKVKGDFQLYFAPFTIKFLAEELSIPNPDWATSDTLFTARRIETRIAPLSLLFGTTRLHMLDLEGATADLEWNAAGTANSWTLLGSTKPLTMPAIARATIENTRIRYTDPLLQLAADVKFGTVAATDSRIGQAVRFSGSGKLRKTPFTLTGALLSPDETLARGANQLQLTANTAHDRIDISGKLPGLAQFEGVPLAVSARGRNAAELFAVLAIIIPDTRAYRLNASLVKQGPSYRFEKMTGVFGASDIAGRFTLETGGARRHVDADLTTRTLDIIDVAPFIGYNPDLVEKRGVEAAAAETGAGPARLLPDATLRAEGLRLFDADVRYKVDRMRSDSVPVSDIAVTVALDDGLLTLSPFAFTMARGKVTSAIGIDWRRRPARTTYDIRLGTTPLATLLGGWGVEQSGTSGTVRGRIQLTGDGDTLHSSLATSNGRIAFVIPKGSFWTRNVQLAELDFGTFVQKMFEGKLKEPVQINCGLVAFTVRNGAAGADPILIDTTKNVVLGRGGFSFKDEALALQIRADAKKFSLVSAQSPVSVVGTFANPALTIISPELVGRAAAAAGLALALPPAAILAFVDVGDAKSTACAPVLAAQTAAAQRTTRGEKRDDVGSGKTPAKERKKFLGIF